MTLGLASPTCRLMLDSARANTQANHSRWHTHKCLMNNTDCVCHGDKVGAGFERREGGTGANRVRHGARATDWRHSQNGPEPRTVCGTRIRKRPTENSWFLEYWWSVAESNHGHADFQSAALPTELTDHVGEKENYKRICTISSKTKCAAAIWQSADKKIPRKKRGGFSV